MAVNPRYDSRAPRDTENWLFRFSYRLQRKPGVTDLLTVSHRDIVTDALRRCADHCRDSGRRRLPPGVVRRFAKMSRAEVLDRQDLQITAFVHEIEGWVRNAFASHGNRDIDGQSAEDFVTAGWEEYEEHIRDRERRDSFLANSAVRHNVVLDLFRNANRRVARRRDILRQLPPTDGVCVTNLDGEQGPPHVDVADWRHPSPATAAESLDEIQWLTRQVRREGSAVLAKRFQTWAECEYDDHEAARAWPECPNFPTVDEPNSTDSPRFASRIGARFGCCRRGFRVPGSCGPCAQIAFRAHAVDVVPAGPGCANFGINGPYLARIASARRLLDRCHRPGLLAGRRRVTSNASRRTGHGGGFARIAGEAIPFPAQSLA